jgi:hypothetical protein
LSPPLLPPPLSPPLLPPPLSPPLLPPPLSPPLLPPPLSPPLLPPPSCANTTCETELSPDTNPPNINIAAKASAYSDFIFCKNNTYYLWVKNIFIITLCFFAVHFIGFLCIDILKESGLLWYQILVQLILLSKVG